MFYVWAWEMSQVICRSASILTFINTIRISDFSESLSSVRPQIIFLPDICHRFSIREKHEISRRIIISSEIAYLIRRFITYFIFDVDIVARHGSLFSCWILFDRTELIWLLIGIRLMDGRLNWTLDFIFLNLCEMLTIFLVDKTINFIELIFDFLRKRLFLIWMIAYNLFILRWWWSQSFFGDVFVI